MFKVDKNTKINPKEFFSKDLVKNFSKHKESLNRYPYSSKVMCDEFYSTFLNLSSTKKIKHIKTNKFLSILYLRKNLFQKQFNIFNILKLLLVQVFQLLSQQ